MLRNISNLLRRIFSVSDGYFESNCVLLRFFNGYGPLEINKSRGAVGQMLVASSDPRQNKFM